MRWGNYTKCIPSVIEDSLKDFSHANLFLVRNEDKLCWSVLYSWLNSYAESNI